MVSVVHKWVVLATSISIVWQRLTCCVQRLSSISTREILPLPTMGTSSVSVLNASSFTLLDKLQSATSSTSVLVNFTSKSGVTLSWFALLSASLSAGNKTNGATPTTSTT